MTNRNRKVILWVSIIVAVLSFLFAALMAVLVIHFAFGDVMRPWNRWNIVQIAGLGGIFGAFMGSITSGIAIYTTKSLKED